MEKRSSSNIYEFDAQTPQQILANTSTSVSVKIEADTTNKMTSISTYDHLNENDIYTSQKNSINSLGSEPWSDYRNNDIVTAGFFAQGNMVPLLNNNNPNEDNSTFDQLYRQQIPSANFQEQQFSYAHHRGSLPIIQRPNDLLNPPTLENMSATMTNTNFIPNRRYTEGSIPRYGTRKQRLNSNSSTNSKSKGEDEELLSSEEVKRKHFLERNRQAALKCRQRKKQWLANLQHRVEFLTTDNEQLQSQATILREEVLNLKTLLLAHRDCKVAQANGTTMNIIQNASSSNTQQQQLDQEQYSVVPIDSKQHVQRY